MPKVDCSLTQCRFVRRDPLYDLTAIGGKTGRGPSKFLECREHPATVGNELAVVGPVSGD